MRVISSLAYLYHFITWGWNIVVYVVLWYYIEYDIEEEKSGDYCTTGVE